MKFGKHLLKQQLPEWASHYINYKALKKRIKNAENTADPGELAAAKKEFFSDLDRDLEKVNTFYVLKEGELRARLKLLLEKKKVMLSTPRRNTEALQSFWEAFMWFQHELIKLQNFVEMNATGFRKILKKFDRRMKATTKEMYLASFVDVQPCFNRDILAELADVAAANLSELNHLLREDEDTFDKFMESTDYLEKDLMKAVAADDTLTINGLVTKLRSLDVNNDNNWLNRAFRRACVSGRANAAQLLLQAGADNAAVNDISGRTCLHETTRKGYVDVLKLLLERDASIDAEDMHGRRALHYAIMGNFLECARVLISKGAALNSMDLDGTSPLVCAIINGFEDCARLLLEHLAPSEALVDSIGRSHLALACQYGHAGIAQMLLDRGGSISDVNSEGLSLLHLSCAGGFTECVRLLVSRGADVHAIEKDNQWTALFFAASEGYTECVRILLEAGAKVDVSDESGWTPWQFALYAGHFDAATLLRNATANTSATPEKPSSGPVEAANNDSATTTHDADDDVAFLDLDGIPSLALPPPIIPSKIYGHSFLENKVQVQIKFGNPSSSAGRVEPLRLMDSRQSSTLKLNISAKPDLGIPHTVTLPLEDEQETFIFVADSLDTMTLQFDVMPMFGSKVIGRAVALPTLFASAAGSSRGIARLPVLDTYLDLIGELAFEFLVVRPFDQAALSVGGKIKTYWKTTTVLNPRPVERPQLKRDLSAVPSMVTGSSLVNEYVMLNVVMTRDGVPVIWPKWILDNSPFDLAVCDLTFAQLQSLISRDNKRKEPDADRTAAESIAAGALLTLHQALTTMETSVGICLELIFPSESEISRLRPGSLPDPNVLVDTILKVVYNVAGVLDSRSLMFSSTSPQLCLIANLKQPNFPVMFQTWAGTRPHPTDNRCNSIQRAVRFAKSANLLGIICEASPLVQVPALIKMMKEEGLIVASFGEANTDAHSVHVQEVGAIDAIVANNRMRVAKTSQQWF